MNRLFALFLVLWSLACAPAHAVEQVGLDENLARRSLDRALMCMAIYDRDIDAEVVGWSGPAYHFGGYDFREGTTGLHAGVYHRVGPDGGQEAVLAYRGTEPNQLDDWFTDLSNYWGLVPDAYLEAGKFAQAARAVVQREGCMSFSLTGHSLGGGMASYAALLIGIKTTCFGSSALGQGMQDILWREASPRLSEASSFVVHVFKEDDVVPPLTATNGRHYGAVASPLLRSPPDYANITSPEEKLGYLAISGFLTHKWLKAGAKVAAAQIMEGHGIDQYVAGLTHLISPPNTFDPAGEWLSKGSFFDVTSTETRFRFCRNGRFSVINDIKFFELARQRTNDTGTWEFRPPHLLMTVPGVARMTYLLSAGANAQTVEWRRLKMEADMTSVENAASPEQRSAAIIAAKMIEMILKRMEGKAVIWTKTPPSMTPQQTTPSP